MHPRPPHRIADPLPSAHANRELRRGAKTAGLALAHQFAQGAQHEGAEHAAARDDAEVAIRVLEIHTEWPQAICHTERSAACGLHEAQTRASLMSETLALGPCASA